MQAGSTIPELFQNYHEQKLSESEKLSREALDGKCDGYMWGLGGARKRKCSKSIGFLAIFWRVKDGPSNPRKQSTRRVGDQKRSLLGSFESENVEKTISFYMFFWKKYAENEKCNKIGVRCVKIAGNLQQIHQSGVRMTADT